MLCAFQTTQGTSSSQAATAQAQQLQWVHKYFKYWDMFGNLILAKTSRWKRPRELLTQFLTLTLLSHQYEAASISETSKITTGLQTETREHWQDICPGEDNYQMNIHVLFQYKHWGGEGKQADNVSKAEGHFFTGQAAKVWNGLHQDTAAPDVYLGLKSNRFFLSVPILNIDWEIPRLEA